MTATLGVGSSGLRAQIFDKELKGFAMRSYKLKSAVTISPTKAYRNFFYREASTILSGPATNAIKGVPPGGTFGQARVLYEKVQSDIDKFGLDGIINWEDIQFDDIDAQNRTLIRISEAVTKAVDDEIFRVLSESGAPTNINSFTPAASWGASTADIIGDLSHADLLIGQADYSTEKLNVYFNPIAMRDIKKYLTSKGAQFPKVAEGVLGGNGVVGTLMNYTFIQSNSVAASLALVVVPRRCGTWKEAWPLATDVKEEAFIGTRIRAVEVGTTQLTDARAVTLIIGIG